MISVIQVIEKKIKNKVFWSLERNHSNLSYISFSGVNFKNLSIKFHVLNVLNIHVKFHSIRMLFTIRSMNLLFIHNFRLQKLEILTFV